jgi:hypothetical protein
MKLTINQALQRGIPAHKEGKLQDAERLYRAILRSQSTHPDANHNLGVLAVIKPRNCFLTRKFWCQNSSVHLRIRIMTPRGRNHASPSLLGPCAFGSILGRINRVSLDVQPRPKRFQMSVGESSEKARIEGLE